MANNTVYVQYRVLTLIEHVWHGTVHVQLANTVQICAYRTARCVHVHISTVYIGATYNGLREIIYMQLQLIKVLIARWRHTSKRPVCRYTGYQHCSNLQAPKHYLIRAANYLLAQNGSKNSNIVNLVLVYDFLRSLYLFRLRSVLWWGTRFPNAS